MKNKKAKNTTWSMSHNEPDEFWFGEGYYEIRSSDDPEGYVVTGNAAFAKRVLQQLNEKTTNTAENEESPNSKKASKISALISQMERHQNLNKEDMPLVVEVLKRELDFLNRLEGNK